MRHKYSEEQLVEAISKSVSVMGVMRELGYAKFASGTHHNISKRIKKLGIDISHFTGQGHNKGKTLLKKLSSSDILVIRSDGRRAKTPMLKRAMIESGVSETCFECGLTEWNGKKMTLAIHHIDGNFLDNTLQNLIFLCPNCHYFYDRDNARVPQLADGNDLESFGSEFESRLGQKQYLCADCGKPISKRAKKCKRCIGKMHVCKINWPDLNSLIEDVEKSSYVAVAKKLGVSNTAVKRHIEIRSRWAKDEPGYPNGREEP